MGRTAGDFASALLTPSKTGVAVYRDDPVGFARDCIYWPRGRKTGIAGGLAEYQEEVLTALVEHERVAVRGPRTLGKTFNASVAIIWFALTRDACGEDWKVVVTAGAWSQLQQYLWPEVRTKLTPRLNWDAIGREPFKPAEEMTLLGLRLRYGAVTMAAPTDSGKIEGAHADELFVVLDEAKLIPESTWNSLEGAFAGAGPESDQAAYALASSTPGAPEGRFFKIHDGAAGYEDWHAIWVQLPRVLKAKRMTEVWRKQRAEQFGEDSAWYANHVLGEFARQQVDRVIRQDHLEEANERWRLLELGGSSRGDLLVPAHDSLGPLEIIGADIAGRGEDRTVYALRHGMVISAVIVRPHEPDTAVTTDDLEALAKVPERAARVVIDAIGQGEVIANELRKRGRSVVDFVASERTDMRTRGGQLGFTAVRDAAWWNLREMLEPGSGFNLAIPPDDQLTADLLAPRWEEVTGGKIKVEPKKEIRKRLERSTDCGDAVVQSYFLSRIAPVVSAPRILRRPGGSRNAPLKQRAGGGVGFGRSVA